MMYACTVEQRAALVLSDCALPPFFFLASAYRDIVLHGFGGDCINEGNAVVILAESIESTDRLDEFPDPPKGLISWRVTLHDLKILFQATSDHSSHMMVTFVLDPKVRARDIVNYVIKKCACLFMKYLGRFAEKVVKDGHDHSLTNAMAKDPFYTHFLAPRFWW